MFAVHHTRTTSERNYTIQLLMLLMLMQLRSASPINGQHTVANPKYVLVFVGLSVSGPKAELTQQLFDHRHLVQGLFGMAVTCASDAVVDDDEKDGDADEDEDDVSCEFVVAGQWDRVTTWCYVMGSVR